MIHKKLFIRDLRANQQIQEYFILARAEKREAKNGPFWALQLADSSGEIAGKIFSPASLSCPELCAGQLVCVQAKTNTYREQMQLVVQTIAVTDTSTQQFSLADFVPSSRQDPKEMFAELTALCETHLRYPPWLELFHRVFADPDILSGFLYSPGGITVHHAYVGGLLEHTLSVCRLCMSFCDLYPALDRQALLIAAAFHDFGKIWEYTGVHTGHTGLTRDYSDKGRLLGHISMGTEKLGGFMEATPGLSAELILHVRHIMLSHHGEMEFGSPKPPQTAEAFALHFADNMDAKMNTVATATARTDQQNEQQETAQSCLTQWTPYIRSLSRALYTPQRTPAAYEHTPDNTGQAARPTAPLAADPADKGDPAQCLLPLKE